MTRKDYVAIAAAIAKNHLQPIVNGRDESYENGRSDSARAIADVMARDNARFNRERFLKACGVQS